MEKIDYKIIKESFFNSYKSFINVMMLTKIQNNIYNILILRKPINDSLTHVSVIIRSNNNNDNSSYHEQISNMILNNEEASNLIDDIRTDFRDNHDIAYSSVNPHTKIQTLQNTKFSLNIKLIDKQEYEEAINFNNNINCNKRRYKVLTTN